MMSVTYWKTFVSRVLGKVEGLGVPRQVFISPRGESQYLGCLGLMWIHPFSLLLTLPPTGAMQVPFRASPGADRPSGSCCTVNLCCHPHQRLCFQQSTQQRYNGPDSRCFSVMQPFRKWQAEPGRKVSPPLWSHVVGLEPL